MILGHMWIMIFTFIYLFRAEFSAPLFKSGLTKAENVKLGDILSGRVNNVTHFGAFVDIGIGINGLVHSSKMKGKNILCIYFLLL